MGFFNDLKEDLASAVNELTDEKVERDIALSGEHFKEEASKYEEKKKNKKRSNENLEREIQNILNGIDENAPIETSNEEVQEEENTETEETVVAEETSKIQIEIVPEEVSIEEEVEAFNRNAEISESSEDSKYISEEYNDSLTLISASTGVKGSIESQGSVEIDGTVEGDVKAGGELIVTGTVIGNVEGLILSLNGGKIRGNVKAYNGIYLSDDAVLIGDIESNEAEIGGAVKGKIDVNGPVVLKTGAKVLGDIDCKSVQIQSGAVIEGKCSQKYADVSPSAFFENL